MNYIIITGTSSGLGEAIAYKLLSPSNTLFCISRRGNDNLLDAARSKGCNAEYHLLDLNKTGNIQGLANTIFEKINDDAKTISLINNAGMLAPVRPVEECSPEEIITNNNVNLVAPMILSSLFIKFVKNFNAEKRIINISSGAGKYPINGWSSYCTSKSGIDMFTQCCALEQDNKEGSVKVLSFAPGIVDTDMQKEIRSMSSENFPEVNKFIEYKEKGHLLSPEYAAGKIAELLFSNDFIQGDITRIK